MGTTSFVVVNDYYIMPPIPPPGIAGIAGSAVFFSAKTHSVVSNIEAIETAFSNATRDTISAEHLVEHRHPAHLPAAADAVGVASRQGKSWRVARVSGSP